MRKIEGIVKENNYDSIVYQQSPSGGALLDGVKENGSATPLENLTMTSA